MSGGVAVQGLGAGQGAGRQQARRARVEASTEARSRTEARTRTVARTRTEARRQEAKGAGRAGLAVGPAAVLAPGPCRTQCVTRTGETRPTCALALPVLLPLALLLPSAQSTVRRDIV